MKTVRDYCQDLGWTVTELSRQAGLSWQAANNAYNDEKVQWKTKRDICSAFSEALAKTVKINDISWRE